MSGEDGSNVGKEKMIRLLRSTRYLRRRLKHLGFLIYGHEDSPVVPMMTFFVTKVVYEFQLYSSSLVVEKFFCYFKQLLDCFHIVGYLIPIISVSSM